MTHDNGHCTSDSVPAQHSLWPGDGPGRAETQAGKEELQPALQEPHLRTQSLWTRFSSQD